MKSMSTFALLSLLVGCSGADFNVGATRGDTGDAVETNETDTGADLDAENDSGAEAPTETSVDTGADTGTPPTDTGFDTGSDTGSPPIDTGTDSGPVDTGTPPTDTGPEVGCPDNDGDGQKAAWCGGTDCHDGNKDVFLGQPAWFYKPYSLPDGGTSWDYNCNGKVDYPSTSSGLGGCTYDASKGTCKVTMGWVGPSVPPCGVFAPFISSCTVTGSSCSTGAVSGQQACN